MVRRKKALENDIIKVGDTVRVNYKLSPLNGAVAKVEKILGNRSRPCYQCIIDGQVKHISRAFLEKIEEEKAEQKEEVKEENKNEDNGNN